MDEYLALNRKIHNKIREIEISAGFKALNEIKRLKDSVYIYRENFKELENILTQYKDVDFADDLVSERYSEKREEKTREFLRAFHNFILSVKSLVAHSRNFMKSYSETLLGRKYSIKIESEFKENEEVKFLEKLRNYFCHYRLPEFNTRITISFDPKSESSNIYLLKKDLLKNDSWGSLANKFIDKCPDEINIGNIIYRYKESTDELYNWLFTELEKLHLSEINQTKKMIQEYEELHLELLEKSPFKSLSQK